MQPEPIRTRSTQLAEGDTAARDDGEPAADPEAPSALDYVHGIVRRGRLILAAAFAAALITAIISLFLPSYYRARTTFLPAAEERTGSSVTAAIRGLLNPGAGLPDMVQAGDLSVSLLRSRRVREPLVEEFELRERYEVDDLYDALLALDGHMTFHVGQEGMVVVMVEDRDPDVAAAMANRTVALLDRFNAEQRMTRGRRSRKFVEVQLANTQAMLETAEDALGAYQAETKSVPLTPDVASAVSAGANLLSEKMQLELELVVKGQYLNESSTELARIRHELATLDHQLEALPALNLEFARLLRDVKVQEEVYGFLRAQYEEAKIREQEDTPSLTVVDEATTPKLRTRPRRKYMVVTAAMVAGLIASLLALAATYVDLLPPTGRRRRALAATGRELRDFVQPGRRRS